MEGVQFEVDDRWNMKHDFTYIVIKYSFTQPQISYHVILFTTQNDIDK